MAKLKPFVCPVCYESIRFRRSEIESHLMQHAMPWCTVCDRIQVAHPRAGLSPEVFYPCEGGIFTITDEKRRF
jgi:hypothetical protein